MEISLTEENYMKAIFSLQLNADEVVSNSRLAEHFNTRAASATDMLQRLADKKLVHYKKYQGVTLTTKGHKLAVHIVRRHRLWEVFLYEKLQFKWDEVHDLAEQLEHIQSEELTNRLDKFLNHPKCDPHGDPIPDKKGQIRSDLAKPLTHIIQKGYYRITRVTDHSKSFLNYLTEQNICIGDVVKLEEINAYDASCKLKTTGGQIVFLSQKAASHILAEFKK